MAKKAYSRPPIQVNVVAEGTVLEGTLHVREDMRVSGRIIGTVTAKKRVVVAPEGVIDGEMVAASADVFGRVHGDLTVAEHLVLRSGARVEGGLKTEQFTVEKGAVFNGTCQMGKVATPPQAARADGAETSASPHARDAEAPALPDWVDVVVEQKESALEKAALPAPTPEPPKWTPTLLRQSPRALGQDDVSPRLAEPEPLADEAEAPASPMSVEVTLRAEETERVVPPSPVEEAPQDHEKLHQEHENLPASVKAQPAPLSVPATATWNRPEEKSSSEQEQPSSKRGTPVVLGIFLVTVLTIAGYFGLRSMGQDPAEQPSGEALASTDIPVAAPVAPVNAPITEEALLPAEDEAEDVTPPPDEPADAQAAEQEQLAPEQALDDEEALPDQADPPETAPDDPPETTEATPESAVEEEDSVAVPAEEDPAAVQAEVVSTVQRLTGHLKASIEGENVSGMDALFYRGWTPFFEEANAILAAVRSENVQVSGTQATVEIYVDLDYMDNDDQRQQSARSYRWNLTRLSDGWVLTQVRAQ